MPNPEDVALQFGAIDVVPCKWAARGVPRLIPDPRQLVLPFGVQRRPQATRLVIVVHPDDVPALAGITE